MYSDASYIPKPENFKFVHLDNKSNNFHFFFNQWTLGVILSDK